MTVFADAYFYVAFINQRDEHHPRVMAYANGFRGRIVTTQWILTEVADALASSACRPRVGEVFRTLEADEDTRVVEVSPAHFARGMALFEGRPDKAWSLTDCISFVVMRDEGLSEALTGDRHFAQAGFLPVFAP